MIGWVVEDGREVREKWCVVRELTFNLVVLRNSMLVDNLRLSFPVAQQQSTLAHAPRTMHHN